MSKDKRSKSGFNTPFADVELPTPPEPMPEPEPAKPDLNDEELFARAVEGTTPLDEGRGRIEPAKREITALPDDEQLALLELQSMVQGKGVFEIIEAEEELYGKAPGVSRELLEQLRTGHFSFRRHVDLHGMSRQEAKEEVLRFVAQARRDGERCVLVVTGRGKSSPTGVSVLRQTLPRWLSRAPLSSHVLAFCGARQVDGGAGAFYVLLRRPGVRPYGLDHE